jgi:hypothetical protein
MRCDELSTTYASVTEMLIFVRHFSYLVLL